MAGDPAAGHAVPVPAGGPACFEVLLPRVAVRSAPSTRAVAVSVVRGGESVVGVPHDVGGGSWLLLGDAARQERRIWEPAAWVVISERGPGLGDVLREVPTPPPDEDGGGEEEDAVMLARVEERLSLAEAERSKGEPLFQRRQYRQSAEAYRRGLDALKDTGPDALYGIVRELKAGLCCGAARALLEVSRREGHASRLATCREARELAGEALALLPAEVLNSTIGSSLDLSSLHFEALLLRGRANAAVGDLDAARNDIDESLRLRPHDREADRELQSILERLGQARILAVPGFKQSEGVTSVDADEGIADGTMMSRLSDLQARRPRRGSAAPLLPPTFMARGERK